MSAESDAGETQPFRRHKPEDRIELLELLVHSCDLSAQVYKQEIAVKWGDRITEEFKRQSKKEAALNLPRTLPEAYEDIDVMKSQIGFVSKIVKVS